MAIEARRADILHELLSQDVEFRDIFWAPAPSEWTWVPNSASFNTTIPVLHDIDESWKTEPETFCGHMSVDVEVQTRFKKLMNPKAYILVSLPMMAHWYSTADFDAEAMLRSSGKFDLTAPQFFHVQMYSSSSYRQSKFGPLTIFDKESTSPEKYLECQVGCTLTVFDREQILQHTFNSPLSRVFYDLYETISRPFHGYDSGHRQFRFKSSKFHQQLLAQLQAGCDLNDILIRFQSQLWTGARHKCVDVYRTFQDGRYFHDMVEYIRFVLRNGLAYFYDDSIHPDSAYPRYSFNESFVMIAYFYDYGPDYREETEYIAWKQLARQLLALGYGRRELHPHALPVRDEGLAQTRREMMRRTEVYERKEREGLQQVIAHFDSGPLTLQQLARVAIRRALGGSHFERRANALAHRLPPAMFEYVAAANEFLRPTNDPF